MKSLHLGAPAKNVRHAGVEVSLEPALVALPIAWRDDRLAQELPDHIGGAPPEDLLGLRVPAHDPPLSIDADNSIQGGFKDPPAVGVFLARFTRARQLCLQSTNSLLTRW